MGELDFSAEGHEDWWRGMEWSVLHNSEFSDNTTGLSSDRNQASDPSCIAFSTNRDEPAPSIPEPSDEPSFENLLDCSFLGPDIPWDDDEFFLPHGAWRPPEPCTYCRRMRLQCFSLQTTDANPNPVRSCSSCVALFRQCSLAERYKRQPHHYETSRPVIDQLHGIREDDVLGDGTANPGVDEHALSGPLAPSSNAERSQGLPRNQVSERGSSYSRSVKRTRPLREWFACNLAHPYPTKAEKTELAQQAGMTRTQINNWFLNARRRQRHSENMRAQRDTVIPHGSPMPASPLSMMTPLDRWRCSPPEDEPITISPAALEKVFNDSFYSIDSPHGAASTSFSTGCASSSISGDSWLHSQPQSLYASSTPDSTSSYCHSNHSNSNLGRLSFDHDGSSQLHRVSGDQPSGAVLKPKFQCTFCLREFKKKFDWKRHELSIHMPRLSSWVCSTPLAPEQSRLIWRTGHEEPECIFCGHASPSETHFETHEFEYCSRGPVGERTFARKDHLWQHLYKFHSCRKWDGWTPDLASLRMTSDAINSRCGFCHVAMASWSEREQHLTEHFLQGLTMASWKGENGGIESNMST
ncbi:hypothetical protein BJX62DRAFT_221253 [Aspergillus germanicus]